MASTAGTATAAAISVFVNLVIGLLRFGKRGVERPLASTGRALSSGHVDTQGPNRCYQETSGSSREEPIGAR
jgi:hypothetical protein